MTTHRSRFTALVTLVAALAIAVPAHAQATDIPDSLLYEGFLEEGASPVAGARDITFSLFVAATGGTSLWSEDHLNVPVAGGFFTVALGDIDVTLPVALGTGRFLEVEVEGTVLGRQEVASVPFAIRAGAVDWADVENKPAGFADDTDDTAGAGQAITAFGAVYLFEQGTLCVFQGPRSSNVTAATYNAGDGSCDITISGVSFDLNSHHAVVSAVGGSPPAIAFWTSVGGKLRLFTKTNAGAIYPAGTIVSFMVIVP